MRDSNSLNFLASDAMDYGERESLQQIAADDSAAHGWQRQFFKIGAILAKQAVAAAFDALNRHDLAAFMAAWREDGEFLYPGAIAARGTFEGRSAVERWFRNFLDQFPKIRFEFGAVCVENIFALTSTNVGSVQWDIYLTNRTGREGRNSGVSVIEIAGGKVVRVKDFVFDLGDNFRCNWDAMN